MGFKFKQVFFSYFYIYCFFLKSYNTEACPVKWAEWAYAPTLVKNWGHMPPL